MKTPERHRDIFHETWGHGSARPFTTDWLAVWRHRAAQHRAEFRRDLRRARIEFAARMAALQETP
jgi:hypothetical protein